MSSSQADVFGSGEEIHDLHERPNEEHDEGRATETSNLPNTPNPPTLTVPEPSASPIQPTEWLRPLPPPAVSDRYPRLRNAGDLHPALRPPQRRATETAASVITRRPLYVFPTDSDEEDEVHPQGQQNRNQESETPAEVGSSANTPQESQNQVVNTTQESQNQIVNTPQGSQNQVVNTPQGSQNQVVNTPHRSQNQAITHADNNVPQTPDKPYVPGNSWSEDAHRQRARGLRTPLSSGGASNRVDSSVTEGGTDPASSNKNGKAPEENPDVRRRYLHNSNPYEARLSRARLSSANLREQEISPLSSPVHRRRNVPFGRQLKTARSLPVIRKSDEIFWERPSPDNALPEIPSFAYPLTSPIESDTPSEPYRALSSDFVPPLSKVSFAEAPAQKQTTHSEHESRLKRYGKRVLSWGRKKESPEQKKKDSPGEKKKEHSLEKKRSMRDLFKKSSQGT